MVAVGAIGLVVVTAGTAATGVLPGEAVLRDAMHSVSSYELRTLARTIRPLGTWVGLVPGLLLLLVTSSQARRRWWLWGVTLVAAPVAGEALQELVGRLRPRGSALGFPSGHATAVGTFAVATLYLVSRSGLRGAFRISVGLATVLAALAIGLSRVVLDAHWPLDVVGGFALGVAVAATAAWWDASHSLRSPLAGPDPSAGASPNS